MVSSAAVLKAAAVLAVLVLYMLGQPAAATVPCKDCASLCGAACIGVPFATAGPCQSVCATAPQCVQDCRSAMLGRCSEPCRSGCTRSCLSSCGSGCSCSSTCDSICTDTCNRAADSCSSSCQPPPQPCKDCQSMYSQQCAACCTGTCTANCAGV